MFTHLNSVKARCKLGSWDAPSWVARAAFRPSQLEIGWATLFVETAAGADDQVAAYAAGYIEGVATAEMIDETWGNLEKAGRIPGDDVKKFVKEQLAFVKGKAQGDDTYSKSVSLVLQQMQGLAEGYATVASLKNLATITVEDMMLIGP